MRKVPQTPAHKSLTSIVAHKLCSLYPLRRKYMLFAGSREHPPLSQNFCRHPINGRCCLGAFPSNKSPLRLFVMFPLHPFHLHSTSHLHLPAFSCTNLISLAIQNRPSKTCDCCLFELLAYLDRKNGSKLPEPISFATFAKWNLAKVDGLGAGVSPSLKSRFQHFVHRSDQNLFRCSQSVPG